MENKFQPSNPVIVHGKMLNGEDDMCYKGFTKREMIAAMAMQGLLANSLYIDAIKANDGCTPVPVEVASTSVLMADELLKQLES